MKTKEAAKHTDGPWSYDIVWGLIKGPKGQEIAAVHSGQGDNERLDPAIAHANARLIAAAPELLDALRAYLAQEDALRTPGTKAYSRAGEQARAAILRATTGGK